MGKKISIDSATMVNKGLEVIEAKYLFNLDIDKINVLVHPQAIIHGLVTYKDNSSIHSLSELEPKTMMLCFGKPNRSCFDKFIKFLVGHLL